MPLYAPPTKNAIQKTLSAQLLAGVTASASLSDVTGIPNKPGIMVIDRVDTNNSDTPTKREYIAYTGTSGSTVTGLTRNVDSGGTDQNHAVGAIVEFLPDVVWAQAIYDALANVVNTSTLAVDTTKIVTPSSFFETLNTNFVSVSTLTSKWYVNATFTGYVNFSGASLSGVATPSNTLTFANKTIDYNSNTIINFPSYPTDGWTAATGTWTYASASTITVPSGAASIYQVGDRIKWTQTTVKYGVITAVADTLLTIAVNTDYTVANATITSPYYSHEANPLGYPAQFNFTTTPSTSGSAYTNPPTINSATYSVVGREALIKISWTYNATSGGTGKSIFSIPFTPAVAYQAGSAFSASDEKAMTTATNITNPSLWVVYIDGTTPIANSKTLTLSISVRF